MRFKLNNKFKLALNSPGALSLSIVLLATSLMSNSSADESCSKSNLDQLVAENIRLQKIIDSEPAEFVMPDGQSSVNPAPATAALALSVNNNVITICKSLQQPEKQTDKSNNTFIDEIEGFEVDIEADILVKKLVGRYQVSISSNLASGSFELLALKKGSRAIKFAINTDEDGNKKFTTKRNLNGYRFVLKYNGDQIKRYTIN
jgi:hypothetical protein